MDLQLVYSEIIVQILGFGLVFFIMKSLLWGRINQAIDDRRAAIEKSLQDLENQKKDLAALESDYKNRLETIHQESRREIQKAVKEGQRIAQEIHQRARQDALLQIDRAKRDIDQEVKKARSALKQDIIRLSTELATKAAKKNISVKDDEILIEEILKEARG